MLTFFFPLDGTGEDDLGSGSDLNIKRLMEQRATDRPSPPTETDYSLTNTSTRWSNSSRYIDTFIKHLHHLCSFSNLSHRHVLVPVSTTLTFACHWAFLVFLH